jgi:uncharacterized protein
MIVTALYTGLLGVLLVLLGLRVALFRMRTKVALGVAENRVLERRVRAHGNLAENAPMAMLMLALLELLAATPVLLHVCGATFVLARVLHAWGLDLRAGPSWQRLYGTILGWTAMLAMALMLLTEAVLRLSTAA